MSRARPSVAIAALILVIASLISLPAPAFAAVQLSLYASPTGSGTACSVSVPCSLTTAQSQARANSANMTGDIVVTLANGTYRLTQTLAFSSASGDSGTNGYSVIYQAASGAQPILNGGKQITGWTQGTGNVWSAPVTAGFDTRQLYVNGVRAIRAAGKSPASFTRTTTGYTMNNSTLSSWGNLSNVEFVYGVAWTQMRCQIASASGTTVTMKQPCFDNSTRKQYGVNADIPNYVENARELLDAPGEWYLNRSTNTVYYMPRGGENLATAAVEAASLQTIVSGTGTAANPLRNLALKGITVAYGTWLEPNGNDGFSEVQANVRLTGANAWSAQGSCDRFSTTNPGTCPYGNWTMTPGNVVFTYTEGLLLERNTFTHLGGAGVELGRGVHGSTVRGNTFVDISGTGLQIGNGTDANPADVTIMPANNLVTNNWVHAIGAEFTGAVGIFQGYARTSTIEYNQVNGVPYSGISSNWGWGRTPTKTTGNVIRNNLVFDWMQVRDDGGGIYVLGPEGTSLATGLTISGNVVRGGGGGGMAIYTDGGSQYVTVSGNAMYANPTVSVGGCNEQSGTPFGDFAYNGNYWEDPTPFWPCGNPTNVTFSSNVDVDAVGTGIPSTILANAGLQAAYADIAAVPLATSATNLAAGKPATALYLDGTTAAMQPGSTPAQAVDGNLSTFAQASGQFRWILQIDLQSTQNVGHLKVTMPATRFATAFHVDTSTNGTTFSTVATVTGTGPGVTTVPLPTASTARYVRIVADLPDNWNQTGSQMGIAEVGVYASGNLALNKSASTFFIDGKVAAMQSGSTPALAVDGSTTTFAQASDQYQWQLLVDLGTVGAVSAAVLTQPSTAFGTLIRVDVSADGVKYYPAARGTGLTSGVTRFEFGSVISARYVRVVGLLPDGGGQTGGQMAISELVVVGPR